MDSSSDTAASSSKATKSTDLLDLLSSGEPPAFANDAAHRIIFWNRGAEDIMGRTAGQTLGRFCHDIFGGRDGFGNRFCDETCAVTNSVARKEPVRRFEVSAGDRRIPQSIGFTIIPYPDLTSGETFSIHILDQVPERGRLSLEIAKLRERAANGVVPLPPHNPPIPEELSTREREVLKSVASGLSNKEIAKALHVSVATIRNHVQHILQKLSVHSKLEAVALAFKHGWV